MILKNYPIGTLEVIDSPMTSFWLKWSKETMDNGGIISIGWRFQEKEDFLPFRACEIADLVTPGVAYAFCLVLNRTANRQTEFLVETSVLGELPPREVGNLFYPSDTRGSLTPIPSSELAWVLPMSTEVANTHIWIYNLAVFHGDPDLATVIRPIIKVRTVMSDGLVEN